MQPQLPAEIIDYIFRLHLSSTPPSAHPLLALRACAKASPLFRPLAERHIYHHLTISSQSVLNSSFSSPKRFLSAEEELSAKDVSKYLRRHPNVAEYVKSVELRFVKSGPGAEFMQWMHRLMREGAGQSVGSGSARKEKDSGREKDREKEKDGERGTIASVLPLLTHLESISLCGCGLSVGRGKPEHLTTWDSLDEAFRVAFVRTLGQKGLKHVEVSWIEGFPLAILDNAPDLESVRLEGGFSFNLGSDEDVSEMPQAGAVQLAKLRKLELGQDCSASMEKIVAWLGAARSASDDPLPPFSLPTLTHLKTTLEKVDDYKHISTILSACKRALQNLVLDPGNKINLSYDAYADADPAPPLPIPANSLPLQLGLVSVVSSSLPPPAPAPPAPAASSSLIFGLSSLRALRHLTLKVSIAVREKFWVQSSDGEGVEEVVYSAPFVWVRKVVDGLGSGRVAGGQEAEASSSSRPEAYTEAYMPSVVGSAVPSSSSLERLTLEITLPAAASPYALSKIRWSPLTSALAAFCSVPSSSSPSSSSVPPSSAPPSSVSTSPSSPSSRRVDILLKMGPKLTFSNPIFDVNGNINAIDNNGDDSEKRKDAEKMQAV
ncbi:hypothetical protein CVT26_004035, partial [Gymnopilus dilepis]